MRPTHRALGFFSLALATGACSPHALEMPTPIAAVRPPTAPLKATTTLSAQVTPLDPPAAIEPVEVEVPDHWYFESLSRDGRRALLRKLDPRVRATIHVRVVDVDSGRTLEETALPELAKIPASTIGGKPTELAELEWMLASPAFGRDIIKGSHLSGSFPFGTCGRLAAASTGTAISFDAGDWLYVADETGRVRRRLVEEAAYDPRFTPDGKYLLFRRATGTVDMFAKYELFAVPSDLSAPPRVLPGTAGMRDRFTMNPSGQSAIAVASQSHGAKAATDTCVISLSLKPPFSTQKLACLEGTDQLVDSVISPKGKWAAISTKRKIDPPKDSSDGPRTEWRLRVVSLANGKTVRDEPDAPGLSIRAISDTGLLVQSGSRGVVVTDVAAKKSHTLDQSLDLGYRGFFRSDTELVYVNGSSVAVLDVAAED